MADKTCQRCRGWNGEGGRDVSQEIVASELSAVSVFASSVTSVRKRKRKLEVADIDPVRLSQTSVDLVLTRIIRLQDMAVI